MNFGTVLFSGGYCCLMFVLILLIIATVVHIMKNPALNDTKKLIYIVLVVVIPIVGILIYLLVAPNVEASEVFSIEETKRKLGEA